MRTGQAKALKAAGCSQIIDLDQHKRDDVLRLARDGRVLVLPYAFLLASPTRKRAMMADFEKALAEIERRGGLVRDLHTGLENSKAFRPAFLAVVKDQIRRNLQGAKSAANGTKHKPGRQRREFSGDQLRQAKAIWRDLIEHPRWEDARAALEQIKTAKGEEFTMARAHKLWGPRERKR